MSSFSCNVRVVSVKGNDGGFGSTAVLRFEQGGGIDFAPGNGLGSIDAEFQVTEDASSLVAEGALLKLTASSA